jgi:hypothetical protein
MLALTDHQGGGVVRQVRSASSRSAVDNASSERSCVTFDESEVTELAEERLAWSDLYA